MTVKTVITCSFFIEDGQFTDYDDRSLTISRHVKIPYDGLRVRLSSAGQEQHDIPASHETKQRLGRRVFSLWVTVGFPRVNSEEDRKYFRFSICSTQHGGDIFEKKVIRVHFFLFFWFKTKIFMCSLKKKNYYLTSSIPQLNFFFMQLSSIRLARTCMTFLAICTLLNLP